MENPIWVVIMIILNIGPCSRIGMMLFTLKNQSLRNRNVLTSLALRGAAGLLGGALLTALGAGCQDSSMSQRFPHTTKFVQFMEHNPKVVPEPPDAPLVIDAAMLERQWPLSEAKWANADLVGWPTRFPFNVDVTTDRPFPNSRVMDTALFLYQYFRLPFTYIKDPPFKTVIWTSDVKYNPTYEAMPAMPPSPDMSKVETIGEVITEPTVPDTNATGGPSTPGDAPTTGGASSVPATGATTMPSDK
jgi:hypothetical protein